MSLNLIKYHGGKAKLADWIVSLMPSHSVYVEPFGGGASVLLSKPSAKSEVYNDLDGEIVNLFRIVRERGDELAHLCNMTPFARDEMELAYEKSECPMERARRFMVRADMAITTTSINEKSGFRTAINSNDYSAQFLTWFKRPESILNIRHRLARVAIENTDAFKLIDRFDRPHTLFYLDPPYYNSTRGKKSIRIGYNHNLSNEDHERLLARIKKTESKVMISGYENELYNTELKDWHMCHHKSYDDACKIRKEVLWMNFEPLKQIEIGFSL